LCRSRKKKPDIVPPADGFDSSLLGDGSELDTSLLRTDDMTLESDQKNGIGAAGITAAEGGSSANISGGEGDTSTQDGATSSDAAPIVTDPLPGDSSVTEATTTPEKPKKKAKARLRSSGSSKKKPSKFVLIFNS